MPYNAELVNRMFSQPKSSCAEQLSAAPFKAKHF